MKEHKKQRNYKINIYKVIKLNGRNTSTQKTGTNGMRKDNKYEEESKKYRKN